jgi:hypothetical protein
MPDEPGTKRVPVFARSPMPVLLTNPTPDPAYNYATTVRVIPGLIRLGSGPYAGGEVVWQNETGDEVTFTFEAARAGQYFDFGSKGPGPFTVQDGEELRLKLKSNPPVNTIYDYRVDCKATPGRPAEGNSPPQTSCP